MSATPREGSVNSRTPSLRRDLAQVDEVGTQEEYSAREYAKNGLPRPAGRFETDLHGREEFATVDPHAAPLSPLHRSASSSSRDPYSTAPSTKTGGAYPSHSPYPSTSSRTIPTGTYPPTSAMTTEEVVALSPLNGGGNYPPALTSRASIRSGRSSIASESVFGTAPVGVIGKTKPREVIRIERDYSAGETCQFWSGWIWELEGRVSPTDFQNTLNELNTVLASAHDPYKSIFDNCLAVLTLYLSPYVFGSHYDREMRNFHRILERANREIYNPAGLNFLSPKRNAFLFLEIEYY
ncbi:hypothetical protein JCM10213_008690 [Rhodosporidiobolus nylandii]